MNLDEYFANLDRKLAELQKLDWMREPVQDAHAEHVKLLFNKGEGGEGNVGKYSTKTMLATEKQFVNKSKFKQSVDEDGKPLWIKFKRAKKAVPVMILDGGYKQFRQIQGRESNFVNLNYGGDLFRDFSTSLQKFSGAWVTGTKRKENSNKVEWLSDKYGEKTFGLQTETKKQFLSDLKKKIDEILNA